MITPDLSENSVGRTYCLHLLCRELQWPNETWSTKGQGALWEPVRLTSFADTCHVPTGSHEDRVAVIVDRARDADLIVAIKPRIDSLAIAWEASERTGVPLLLDIDDPDIAVQQAYGTPLRRLFKRAFRSRIIRDATRMEGLLSRVERTVSNPTLQAYHGGAVVTHVREMPPQNTACRTGPGTRIVFAGSIQPNKGLPVLRRAVAQLANEGFELVVTADPPEDALAHETWVGVTSLEDGVALSYTSDVVVIPSLDKTWSRGQLPVKLVDALLAGTPTVVTSVPPLPWAIGAHGIVVPPNDVSSLVSALRFLGEPEVRAAYGNALRRHAIKTFTIESNAASFAAAARRAVSHAAGPDGH